MKIFAISDLHLSGENVVKPMDIFGGDWAGYVEEITKNWAEVVGEEDIVLIGGDISWAMDLAEAVHDLNFIGKLAGKKILVRGNHDYWWKSISRVREALPAGVFALQNDSIKFDNIIICGTRGWTVPESGADAEDIKIFQREIERLKLSLRHASEKRQEGDILICLMHFPPFSATPEKGFTDILQDYRVDKVVYGHLHGYTRATLYQEKKGTEYYLTSCDKVKNKLVRIL